jgi:hypothetical protein
VKWSKSQKDEFLKANPKKCQICGKEFIVKSFYAFKAQRYCSKSCVREANKLHSRFIIRCEYCSKVLLEREQRWRHFCNDECAKAYLERLKRENPND